MDRFTQLVARYLDINTPFLLMDQDVLQEQASQFKKQAGRCGVFYAVKANADPEVMRLLHEAGIGFEVASEAELRMAQGLGVSTEQIISGNPVKAPDFITAMHQSGVRRFVFDSTTEAEKLAKLAPGSEAIVRLTVDNSSSAWPLADKYGVDVDEALELLDYAGSWGLSPVGVTFHVGSQCFDIEGWRMALTQTSLLWERCEDRGLSLRVLNLGGGFPAHHSQAIPSLPDTFASIFRQVDAMFPSNVELQVEPGRGLVGDAGVMVTTVIGKATRKGDAWLYLDCGVFNGLMEASGGIHYAFWPTTATGPTKPWTVTGPSCDSMDVIAKGVALPELEVGERVLIYPAGAYTTAYASQFNGTSIPQVVMGSVNGIR
jgi:ornithine decarboxylase